MKRVPTSAGSSSGSYRRGRIPTYGRNPRIGVPVKMNEREQQAERPHELHDFGETPQVVFLLHGFSGFTFVRPTGNPAEYVGAGRPGPGMAGKKSAMSRFFEKTI